MHSRAEGNFGRCSVGGIPPTDGKASPRMRSSIVYPWACFAIRGIFSPPAKTLSVSSAEGREAATKVWSASPLVLVRVVLHDVVLAETSPCRQRKRSSTQGEA
jgi:hypothetical protein